MAESKPSLRIIEVLLTVIAVAVIAGWIVGAVPMNREDERISSCSANLRVTGNAYYIYAQDGDNFPALSDGSRTGELRPFAYRNQQPLATDVPSPTAEMWTLLRAHNAGPRQFVCPSSTDTPDPILDTTTAFDFERPDRLSYAYVYQYHPQRKVLGTGSDPRIPLMADANPYLKGNVARSVNEDRKSEGLGNSRNHRARRGQGVLFVDGHAQFMKSPRMPYSPARPYTATTMLADNIYTTYADNEPADPGNAPTWTRIQIGSKSDYCLVP